MSQISYKIMMPFFFMLLSLAHAQKDQPKRPVYKKNKIAKARFGDEEKRQMVKKAYGIKNSLESKIIGQERTLKTLQDRVVQYYESYGTRDKDPIAMHMIGFPGIGKSAMIGQLKKMGFNVKVIDAQKFINQDASWEVENDFYMIQNECESTPCIVLVDELDKLPEIVDGKEKTIPFIGMFNQILTDGEVTVHGSRRLKFSNVMFVSTMNFNPNDILKYSKQAIGVEKSFYEMSIEDFQKYDLWLNQNPTARYLVLSSLFRSNTVSRLAPNTVILKPLESADYKKIAENVALSTQERLTSGDNSEKRIEVSLSPEFIEFLHKRSVFAPSGARETVYKVDALVEQVINAAVKAKDVGKLNSLDKPRIIKVDVLGESEKITVSVTPLQKKGKNWVELPVIQFDMEYDPNSRNFFTPDIVAIDAPPSVEKEDKERKKKITQKDILKSRFPKSKLNAKGLASRINQFLIGQEQTAALIEEEMNQYMSRVESAAKQPMYKIFAGFPGIGKSEIVNQTSAALNLPVVRINMQQYSSDEMSTVQAFLSELNSKIEKASSIRPDGKYLLVIEELDKSFEIHPQSGGIVNRPIMSAIKDLLSEGRLVTKITEDRDTRELNIDIRGAYTFVTMNFGSDLFEFKADPRLTTTEDVMDAYRVLSTRPADLRNVLSKLFLPETISRMLPHFHIMKPLTDSEYKKLIATLVKRVESDRLLDKKTRVNLAQIDLNLSDIYKDYLFNETVIPSEGARYTVNAASNRIGNDLELALKKFKKKDHFAKKPIVLSLDFDQKKTEIVVSVQIKGEKEVIEVSRSPIALTFPRPEVDGALSEDRLIVSIHEFGHAFAAARLGLRFEIATVIPPETGTGGYVKYAMDGLPNIQELIARLYSSLASRTMERIYLSQDPMDPTSVMEITSGSSSDIEGATDSIWRQIFALGGDPNGGTLLRAQAINAAPTNFGDLPNEKIEGLGKVMREMETYMIQDFLSNFKKEWFMEKILEFGRKGLMNEKQFYSMIGFEHPGPGTESIFLGEEPRLQQRFQKNVQALPDTVVKAMAFKQGEAKTTAIQNMNQYSDLFEKLLKEHFHNAKPARVSKAAAKRMKGYCSKQLMDNKKKAKK